MAWQRWSRGKETLETFDFTGTDWTHFEGPRPGSSLLRVNYTRKPAREFASEAEYQEWFAENDRGKGERWRHTSPDR